MGRVKQQQAQNQQKVFSRRLAILGGLKAAMVGTLAARLYYLQVIEGEKYKLLADENRINRRILFPSRGLILDRFGIALASNSPSYRAILVAEQTRDEEGTLDVEGTLKEVFVEPGQQVKKGDLLARLSNVDLLLEIRRGDGIERGRNRGCGRRCART